MRDAKPGPSRASQSRHYGQKVDVASLAAAYGFGLVKNHPYRDGNKRIGFLSTVTFLGINGRDLDATDAEVISEMLALADGRVSEEELAEWIRQHIGKRR
jgi:death on curing protein